MRILSAIGERLRVTLRHRDMPRDAAMPTPSLRRRRLPADPALWVWLAVALMALVPLAEHAAAARLTRLERAPQPARVAPASPGAPAPQSPSASGSATS